MALATDDILAIQKLVADYNHFVDGVTARISPRCSSTAARSTAGSTC